MAGESKLCPTVAFVESTALGNERGVLVVVVKSLVPGVRFCDEDQPEGKLGGATESNLCV
jgi:hypothetical protein